MERSAIYDDWVIRATRYDHRLSSDTRIHAAAHYHAAPTELELDVHDGLEVGIVLAGQEERYYQHTVVTASAGDVWLCAMWEPHGWRVTAPDTENVVLIFRPDFMGEEQLGDVSWLSLFSVPPEHRPAVSDARTRSTMVEIGREIRAEIQTRRPHWTSAVRIGLLRALFALRRGWEPRQGGQQAAPKASSLSRVMPVLSAIHADPGRRIKLDEAAVMCGLSVSQFKRVFTQAMGLAFAQFCLRSRLAYVAHMLLTTDLSLEAIAASAGFADASHLHRAFLRHYRCTPGRYRERAQRGAFSGIGG